MNKINDIIYNFKKHTPQAVNRFNDGEMNAILGIGKISRGQQEHNDNLSDNLLRAISWEQENYWVGIPCKECWPSNYKTSLQYVNKNYEFLTNACVLINRNYHVFNSALLKSIPEYKIYYVCGADQDIFKLERRLNTKIHRKIVKTINAWSDYERIKEATFDKGSLVILSCGATGRVLVYDWFKRMPGCSFFDLGSFFDPITRNRKYRYHTGKLPKCKICN